MKAARLARRNVLHRPLETGLSVLLLAFGVGIISLMLLMQRSLTEDLDRNIKDIDLVLGAKGSPLQLILANVYHVDVPTGNIPLAEARKVMRHPYISEAIPLAYGDNYELFRIVGTEPSYPAHYEAELAEGKPFEAPFEVVIGSEVATATGLSIGDTFYSAHGLTDGTDVHRDKSYTVVGKYARTGSVIDQLLLTPIESVWGVHEDVEDADEEITAVLLKKKNPLAILTLPNLLRDTPMQVALPAIEMNRLTQQFGIGLQTLRAVALLIMGLSFVSVFIALFASLRDRRYELALLRTMGAPPRRLFSLVLFEGLWMTLAGIVAGLLLSRLGVVILGQVLSDRFHYNVTQLAPVAGEFVLVAAALLVGAIAAGIPARSALRIDISNTLGQGR
jgi:putative ABC transport system permease protein